MAINSLRLRGDASPENIRELRETPLTLRRRTGASQSQIVQTLLDHFRAYAERQTYDAAALVSALRAALGEATDSAVVKVRGDSRRSTQIVDRISIEPAVSYRSNFNPGARLLRRFSEDSSHLLESTSSPERVSVEVRPITGTGDDVAFGYLPHLYTPLRIAGNGELIYLDAMEHALKGAFLGPPGSVGAEKFRLIRRLPQCTGTEGERLELDPSGRFAAVSLTHGRDAFLIDLANGDLRKLEGAQASHLRFSSDGKRVGGIDGTDLRIWDTNRIAEGPSPPMSLKKLLFASSPAPADFNPHWDSRDARVTVAHSFSKHAGTLTFDLASGHELHHDFGLIPGRIALIAGGNFVVQPYPGSPRRRLILRNTLTATATVVEVPSTVDLAHLEMNVSADGRWLDFHARRGETVKTNRGNYRFAVTDFIKP
jgi:hypothetical protein